jgi:hypothetical protein
MNLNGIKKRLETLAGRAKHPKASLIMATHPVDDLTALANLHRSDKGDLWFQRHNYTRVYNALFENIRDRPLRFLELGLLHRADRSWINVAARESGGAIGHRAPSLEMWSSYFPRASIVGFDINEFPGVSVPRCTILQGDMANRDDLARLTRDGVPFDVILDDASHASHHQQIAFGFLFRALSPGGMYIIEDLNFQPSEVEKPDAVKTKAILRDWWRTGRIQSPYMTPEEQTYLDDHIERVEFFDSAVRGNLDLFSGALAVIWKRAVSPAPG